MKYRKPNDGLAIIFVIIVVWNIINMLMIGRWLYALFAYSMIPVFVYITVRTFEGKPINFFKFYVAWIPMQFNKKIDEWVKR